MLAGPLSPGQAQLFAQDGYLLLKNFVSAATCEQMHTVARHHLQHAIAPVEYETEVAYPGAPASLEALGGRTIRRLRAAWQRDEHFRCWASDSELRAILYQLLGEPICITLAHHNAIMTKHPLFSSATGWHRDIRYWSFARQELISVWLALSPEYRDNGGLQVIPGSHLIATTREQMDALDFLRPEVPANQSLCAQSVPLQLEQGDIVLFHSLLFHAAGRNKTDQVKFSVVFAYYGQSNRPLIGTRSAAAEDILLG